MMIGSSCKVENQACDVVAHRVGDVSKALSISALESSTTNATIIATRKSRSSATLARGLLAGWRNRNVLQEPIYARTS